MKIKYIVFTLLSLVLSSCNMNPSKEERIKKLETELQTSSKKISELEKLIKTNSDDKVMQQNDNLKLGAFSVSLNVKDINFSKDFYENLGFTQLGGDLDKNYLIMKNENSLIGLFQGMFEGNILTFNPGWDENGKNTKSFDDIRKIQQRLKSKGMDIGTEIDKQSSGPANFMTTDPDGNVILVDQHR